MKVKIEAGFEADLLSRDELRAELAAWHTEITRGVKFVKFAGQGTVVGGAWTIGGQAADNRKDNLGPDAGFVWAITRLAVSGNGFVQGTDTYAVYIDEVSPVRLVVSGLTRGQLFDKGVLVLNGSERLALSGVGTGPGGNDVTVSGQAIELPVQLGWRLV